MTDRPPSTTGALAWRMPAETAPHERTLMCWPARPQIWDDRLREAQLDYAEIARAIAAFEPVTMVARREHAELAADLCGPGIQVVEIPIDDSWARDSGPIHVLGPQGGRRIAGFRFTSWGGKFLPYDDDERLKLRWSELTGEPIEDIDLVLEGGAISVDGEGTLLTTQQCLMHPNRNPTVTRSEMERVIGEALGVSCFLWLPYGLALDDDTDGHVDNVAAFASPGLVVLQGCDDEDEDDHLRMEANRRWVQGACDAAGRSIEVLTVPVLPFVEVNDQRLAVPYLNYYVCNGGVVVPVTGHDADDDMLAIIASAYPGRTVVRVPGETLALGGGGPHCITQQVPMVAGS